MRKPDSPAGFTYADPRQSTTGHPPTRTPNGRRRVLVPFDTREAISPKQAAGIAGRSESTIRNWCTDYGIGRHVGGGLRVSRVALAMHLDDDRAALAAYLSGDRCEELVAAYFRRFGLGAVLKEFQLSACRSQLPQSPQSSQYPQS
jgi:hypothetical protein